MIFLNINLYNDDNPNLILNALTLFDTGASISVITKNKANALNLNTIGNRTSMRIANQLVGMLPRHETPEHTDGYEGFYHLMSFNGDVEKTELLFIIRDFDRDRLEKRKRELQHLVNKVNAEFGAATVVMEMNDQYYNMREKIEPLMYIVELAREAMLKAGVEPKVLPIRGGTDGARLSYMGLPTPNIFAGGHNFHGRFEFVPIPSMEKAVEVILQIAQMAPGYRVAEG